jgi:outer membrane murein-binding lipoprotein Lpp
MIINQSKNSAPSMTRSINTTLVVFASLLLAACAAPQKVDRIHTSVYHQQASIQQLQSDLKEIKAQRQQVASDLQRLQADGGDNQQKIAATQSQLLELEAKQANISTVIQQVNNGVYKNTRSIATLNKAEQKRQDIIKAQKLRWQQITAQTNAKLAEIDRAPADPRREVNGANATDVPTR